MDSDTRSPTAGMPVVVKYLTPKEVWEMYCRSYSNFLKRLQNIIRKGGFENDAFRVIPQEDRSRKRAYNQWLIHPVRGIEWLDKSFGVGEKR